MSDLTVDSHFRFGENWKDFVTVFDENRLSHAEEGLRRLLPEGLSGKTFLDIGSGSGLSSLAALRLGAASVTAVDIDPDSVEATRGLLGRQAPDHQWNASLSSVFDLAPGQFDVVYSWGVLHHTGDMWRAIGRAADQVGPGGRLVLAIYRKTPFCDAWRVEKRWYTRSAKPIQAGARAIYKAAYLAGLVASFRNPVKYLQEYRQNRGMNWSHDVHDWMGGYPYQSASPQEMQDALAARGFKVLRQFEYPPRLSGLLGTACDEFVFERTP